MSETAQAFLKHSAHYLSEHYGPKIKRCLAEMNEDQIWWRPNAESNSIGNLILHLCGNAHQWIVSGVGKAEDVRHRQAEFDALGPMPTEVLVHKLDKTIAEVCGVILAVEDAALSQTRSIQGYEVSILESIYHVVEHFSMHTGQIIYITKLHRGKDLAFYKVSDDGSAFPQW